MAGIPDHTIEDTPAAARPQLAEMVQFSPAVRLLNMPMCRSGGRPPRHGTLDPAGLAR
jgi:hypothetical protein